MESVQLSLLKTMGILIPRYVRSLVRRLKNLYDRSFLSAAITLYTRKTKDVFFVEIGACDGVQADLLHEYILKYHWRGILVEPLRHLFDKLLENYRDQPQLIFENAAIDEKEGRRVLYHLKEDRGSGKRWQEGLGSFNKDVILKHKNCIAGLEDFIVAQDVPCLTVKALIKKYGVHKIDFLQIDTEGYDYVILKTLDFKNMAPEMILFEYIHLSACDKDGAMRLLKDNGYKIIVFAADAFAYLPRVKISIVLSAAFFILNGMRAARRKILRREAVV